MPRNRKPHALRVLEGGRGKSRPLTPDLPAPVSALVAPRGLSREERSAWAQHARDVRQLGLESSVDHGQFLAMVRSYCRALKADRVIAKKGLTVETKSNGVTRRPELGISAESWKTYCSLADKFGLSATARAKLGATEKPPERAGDVPEELADASGGGA